MTSTFLNILEETESVNDPALEVKEANPFQEYEMDIASLMLQETIQSQAPTIDFLTSEHFQDFHLSAIYMYCLRSYEASGRVSKVAIVSELFPNDKEVGELFINRLLMQPVVHKGIVKSCAYEIDEYIKIQIAIKTLEQKTLEIKALKSFSEASKQLDDMAVELAQLTYNQVENKIYDNSELINRFWDNFDKGAAPCIPTGIQSLDKFLGGGMGQGELIIQAGRPGMGKTALLAEIISNVSDQGKNVLSFSIEMNEDQATARFLSRDYYNKNNISIPYSDILRDMRSSNPSDRQKAVYKKMRALSKGFPDNVRHNFTPSIDVNYVVNYAKRHAQYLQREGKRLDFIAVDYLQILDFGSDEALRIAIGKATFALKNLAKSLNVPILLLSQLNRDVSKERTIEEKKPKLHHLKDSGSIEQDADIVLFTHRPSYYEKDQELKQWNENYMEIIVAKNRNGEQGIAKVNAYMACNSFMPWPEHENPKQEVQQSSHIDL